MLFQLLAKFILFSKFLFFSHFFASTLFRFLLFLPAACLWAILRSSLRVRSHLNTKGNFVFACKRRLKGDWNMTKRRLQDFKTSGLQDFKTSGLQEFKISSLISPKYDKSSAYEYSPLGFQFKKKLLLRSLKSI